MEERPSRWAEAGGGCCLAGLWWGWWPLSERRASGKDSKTGTDAIWFTHWKGHSDFCVEDGS